MDGIENIILTNKKKYTTFIHSWPKTLQNHYQNYIFKRNSRIKYNLGKLSFSTIPFWMKLPILISLNYTKLSDEKKYYKSFLKDILWAQNCIFLFMRIQDDVIDESFVDKKLVIISDLFLIEADRIFLNHFSSNSIFWKLYRNSLQTTGYAIIMISELHQDMSPSLYEMKKYYADISESLNIASQAICVKYQKLRELRHIKNFMEEYYTGIQLMDDLNDLKVDLKSNRFNYIVKFLMKDTDKKQNSQEEKHCALEASIVKSNGIVEILEETKQHFLKAEKISENIGIPEMKHLTEIYLRAIDRFQTAFHRERVNILFQNVLNK